MFRGVTSIGLSLLLCINTLQAQAPSAREPTVGKIKKVDGNATLNGNKVKKKQKIRQDDRATTGQAAKVRVDLMDGSTLWIGNGSTVHFIRVNAAAKEVVLRLYEGKVRSLIATAVPPSKYEIQTPQARAEVAGTDFYVAATSDRTIVVSRFGKVRVVYPPSNDTVTIHDGQMVEVTKAGFHHVGPASAELMASIVTDTTVVADLGGGGRGGWGGGGGGGGGAQTVGLFWGLVGAVVLGVGLAAEQGAISPDTP